MHKRSAEFSSLSPTSGNCFRRSQGIGKFPEIGKAIPWDRRSNSLSWTKIIFLMYNDKVLRTCSRDNFTLILAPWRLRAHVQVNQMVKNPNPTSDLTHLVQGSSLMASKIRLRSSWMTSWSRQRSCRHDLVKKTQYAYVSILNQPRRFQIWHQICSILLVNHPGWHPGWSRVTSMSCKKSCQDDHVKNNNYAHVSILNQPWRIQIWSYFLLKMHSFAWKCKI